MPPQIATFTDVIDYQIVEDICYGATGWADHLSDMIANQASHAWVFRLGQQTWPPDDVNRQVTRIKPYNLPWGVYWAFGPYSPIQAQVDKFLLSLKGITPGYACLWTDFELHSIESPAQRHDLYSLAVQLLRARIDANLVVGNYSGAWWLYEYMPDYLFLKAYPYWNASYPVFLPRSWREFHKSLRAYNMPIVSGLTVDMWQFAGDLITPMVPHQLDYSVIRRAGVFQHLFSGAALPPPPIPPPPVVGDHYIVVSYYLSVRYAPDPNAVPVVAYLTQGTPITVTEYGTGECSTWGLIAPGRWVNTAPKYCKKIP